VSYTCLKAGWGWLIGSTRPPARGAFRALCHRLRSSITGSLCFTPGETRRIGMGVSRAARSSST
jgi:hypothetical protein